MVAPPDQVTVAVNVTLLLMALVAELWVKPRLSTGVAAAAGSDPRGGRARTSVAKQRTTNPLRNAGSGRRRGSGRATARARFSPETTVAVTGRT
ncbi:hypothetical protein GCM10022204_17160 [Microlunatus aurantiacus]|uniref:Secreted protein n=1 Tax=Microlunatus aurantiacus TaxID=446786 RepID=A0ABP7D5H8_9ACTN